MNLIRLVDGEQQGGENKCVVPVTSWFIASVCLCSLQVETEDLQREPRQQRGGVRYIDSKKGGLI